MIKGVIYARFSSSKQREESIEAQVRECTEYAKKQSIDIIDIYADYGISGTTDERPEFQRMIQDSKNKGFQKVILYGIDRFARDRYLAAFYKNELKKNGVSLAYAKNDIPDSPEGVLLESIMEGFAEYYSKNLGRNTSRGMNENARKGKYNGGPVPLGYKIIDKMYVIDEDLAPIIKNVFKDFSEGFTVKGIIDKYQPLIPVRLTYNKLHYTFSNEKYIGLYKCGNEYFETIPPLIEKDIFEKCKERVRSKSVKRSRKNNKPDYILSGKLYCGNCNSLMTGESGRSKSGQNYYYYKCVSKKKKLKDCSTKALRKEEFENFIVNETMKYLLTEDTIDYISTQVMKLVNKEKKVGLKDNVDKRIKEIDSEMNNTLDLMIKFPDDEKLQNKYKDLKEQMATLKETNIFEEKIAPLITEDMIKFWLTSFKDDNVDDFEFKYRLINTLVNRVIYYNDDNIDIFYNVSGRNGEPLDMCSTNLEKGYQLNFNRTLYVLNDCVCLVKYEKSRE